jgi:hypothetical protein
MGKAGRYCSGPTSSEDVGPRPATRPDVLANRPAVLHSTTPRDPVRVRPTLAQPPRREEQSHRAPQGPSLSNRALAFRNSSLNSSGASESLVLYLRLSQRAPSWATFDSLSMCGKSRMWEQFCPLAQPGFATLPIECGAGFYPWSERPAPRLLFTGVFSAET